MAGYSKIYIIYNPVSTGPSKQAALALAEQLKKSVNKVPVKCLATKHAGHAESLAYDMSKSSKRPLIISSSGDGGYHEVVNGIMKANQAGADAVAGLLPAGNANDHFNHFQSDNLLQTILKGTYHHIDLLQVKVNDANKPWQRFAHSYAGIGLTPHAGKQLNRSKLNRFSEKIVVIKSFLSFKPTVINQAGRPKAYDSLVFSNIDRMAKYLNLSNRASVSDGKFEVIPIPARNKLALLGALIKQASHKAPAPTSRSFYSFETIKPLSMQLDGEIYKVAARTGVEIRIMPKALACIL